LPHKNIYSSSTMFPHRKIYNCTLTSPDGKAYIQTDHFLVDRRRQSSIPDVRSFRGADCDTDHYLVSARRREQRTTQTSDMQIFYVKKLNDAELRNSIRSKSQTGLQLRKTWMIMWTSIGLGKKKREYRNFNESKTRS
jgi:hypothetical protein